MDKPQMEVDTQEETGQQQGGGDKTEKQGETSQQEGSAIQEGAISAKRQLPTSVSEPQQSTSGSTPGAQQSIASVLQQAISMAQSAHKGTSGLQLMSEYLMSASKYKVTFC